MKKRVKKTELEKRWAKEVAAHKAPLVEVDRLELTDKRLNPEEAVIREREELLKMAAKKKIAGQEELENPERSAGPRMSWQEVLRRILICNPQIKVKDGSLGSLALYIRKKPDEIEESDYEGYLDDAGNLRRKSEFFIDHKYVGGFEKEPLPQWSHVLLDSSHLATREIRGWRSVLMRLIKARVISYESAIEQFGNPELDQRSGRWFEQLAKFRNA
jgi:hypothetical protein